MRLPEWFWECRKQGFAMRLVGLDFETANSASGSICAAGCAIVEDGVVLEGQEWLIFPHKGYRWMRPDFTEIHGLHYWDVCNSPEFPEVWPDLREMLLSAECVVIHNAPFDLGQLRSVLSLYDLPPVEFDYVDSVRLSRRCFPEMSSHSLDAMAERFGIQFRHHDALEDAAACAVITAQMGVPNDLRKHFDSSSNLRK
jgi:DNA polymerase III subunit epsilon